MYKIIRNLLFRFPPESVHYFSMDALSVLCSTGLGRSLVSRMFLPAKAHSRELLGLKFRNAVGLGAGFDKNARYLRELEALGFGSVEIGTVTPLPQLGNDKPRLFRLKEDLALINRMGFNNDGVERVAARLAEWRRRFPNSQLIVGGNIGKNKATLNENAWKDYETCFKELHPYVDYFVVNVSSPNTPGLRELQEKTFLRRILIHLQMINNGKARSKPVLLKIAPDLSTEQLDDVIELAMEIKLDGLVCTNTTISRDGLITPHDKILAIGAGGLSGKPVQHRSTSVVKYIHQKTDGMIPVIASGGIFNADDAKQKINAGASLVQVWTGFIYEGPSIVKNICKGVDYSRY